MRNKGWGRRKREKEIYQTILRLIGIGQNEQGPQELGPIKARNQNQEWRTNGSWPIKYLNPKGSRRNSEGYFCEESWTRTEPLRNRDRNGHLGLCIHFMKLEGRALIKKIYQNKIKSTWQESAWDSCLGCEWQGPRSYWLTQWGTVLSHRTGSSEERPSTMQSAVQ
jgi:hypothetical protein